VSDDEAANNTPLYDRRLPPQFNKSTCKLLRARKLSSPSVFQKSSRITTIWLPSRKILLSSCRPSLESTACDGLAHADYLPDFFQNGATTPVTSCQDFAHTLHQASGSGAISTSQPSKANADYEGCRSANEATSFSFLRVFTVLRCWYRQPRSSMPVDCRRLCTHCFFRFWRTSVGMVLDEACRLRTFKRARSCDFMSRRLVHAINTLPQPGADVEARAEPLGLLAVTKF
jgi:hypothetical protein